VLIILGAGFIGYSEHVKPKDTPPPAVGNMKTTPE